MNEFGEWILDEDGDGYHCSKCGRDICYVDFVKEEFNYCPSCGKKMKISSDIDVNKAIEWLERYIIVDAKEVYTNGVELVPMFRVKQAFMVYMRDKYYNI